MKKARQLMLLALVPACEILLQACQGGGGQGSEAYVVGGTVSGLSGTVVLQNNGGDDLTLTANGSFRFTTPVAFGGAYKVSVRSQPLGPDCIVNNGSGIAASTVTSISVQCTLDPATFFLPLQASAVVPANAGAPGINGLVLVTSKALATPPVQIVADSIAALGYTQQLSVDARGSIAAGAISKIAYATSGVPGGDSFWTLDLSGSSDLKPVQMTNFSGNAQAYINESVLMGYKNLADPGSEFFVLAAETSGGIGNDVLVLHVGDGPTTAPGRPTGVAGASLKTLLYRPNGMLAGIVANDQAGNLSFYPDETFTNPIQPLPGASIQWIMPPAMRNVSALTAIPSQPTSTFLLLQVGTQTELRRIDYTGALSADLYDFATNPIQASFPSVESVTADANNFYAMDVTQPAGLPPLVSFIAVPIDGSAQARVIGTLSGYEQTVAYVGSTGSQLIIAVGSPIDGYELWTLPESDPVAGLTPVTGGSEWGLLVGGDILQEGWCSHRVPGSCGAPSAVLAIDGTVLSGPFADSYYSWDDYNALFLVSEGAIYVVNQQNPALPVAGPLTPPASSSAYGQGPYYGIGGFSVSSTIVAAGISSQGGEITAAVDLSKNLIIPIQLGNTTLSWPWIVY